MLVMPIYLASASPRRQELLRQIGVSFEVLIPNINEAQRAGELPDAYVTRMALEKARACHQKVTQKNLTPYPLLAADTTVVRDHAILGKPMDRIAGEAMLASLAGRSHEVLTAICVIHEHKIYQALSRSRVTLGVLSAREIARYWDTGEPQDKAGGYGLQGLAASFIARLEGSYSGVVGLPLYELMQIMRKIGWNRE